MIRTLERLQLSNWALLGFFVVLPLSLRHTFLSIPPQGGVGFNEYTDVSLYASDLILAVFLLLRLLENKNEYLSIIWWKRMFHVEQFRLIVLTPLLFLLWCLVSTFWSENQTLAFYASIKLFENYFLFITICLMNVPRGTFGQDALNCSTWNNQNEPLTQPSLFHVEQSSGISAHINQIVPRGTMSDILLLVRKCSTWNTSKLILGGIIISALIQTIIALWQFLAQSSTGLSFLGESYLGANLPGIAKIILLDQVIIRPYGLFPHPNVLASFLGLAILLVLYWPILFRSKMFHVEQSLYFYRATLFLLLFVFLLTFSKSAFLSLIFVVLYITWQMFHVEHQKKCNAGSTKYNVPRGTMSAFSQLVTNCSTWNIRKMNRKMFHVEHLMMTSLAIVVFLIILIVVRSLDGYYFLNQPIAERWYSIQGFFHVVADHFWLGLGVGQSVLLMQDFFVEKLFVWQFQPIHNLFLLIWAEVGIIGLILFLRICSTWNKFAQQVSMFHVEHLEQHASTVQAIVPRGTIAHENLKRIFSQGILIFLFFTALTDHYYWDIQPGQFIFWIAGALVVTINWRVLTK